MDQAAVEPLHPAVLWAWRARAAAAVLALLAPWPVVALVLGAVPAAGATAVALLVGLGLAAWLPAVAHRRWSFQLGVDALELRHGLLTTSWSIVPYFRVQHVDLVQGPLERLLGVARLTVRTASSGTDATLPGIALARAEEVRRLVLDRAEVGDGL